MLAERLEWSWRENASLWTASVRRPAALARRSVAYEAVVQAVLRHSPKRVLDLGCGEGWLCRALAAEGVECVGIDASSDLIAAARRAGGGRFEQLSFDQLSAEPALLSMTPDLIVANFSLLDEAAQDVLQALAGLCAPHAHVVVQAAHPSIAGAQARCGWRVEYFRGHPGNPWRPMPWYFRTLQAWEEALAPGWRLSDIKEPCEAESATPSSLLMTAEKPG